MSSLLTVLAALGGTEGGGGGGIVTPPPGTPMPTTSDPRYNIARRDAGIGGWAAGDPSTMLFTDTVTTMAHGRDPSVLLIAGVSDVTYSDCTLVDVASGYTYPVTVAGQSSWTVPAGGAVETDPITLLSISGTVYQWRGTATRASTAGMQGLAAAALVAHTLTPSVLIIGDSNAPGAHHFAQSGVLAAGLPHINIAGSGNRVETFYAGGKLVDAYLATNGVCLSEIGVNNIDWTVTQLGAGLIQLANRAKSAGQRFYQCTICPRAHSAGASWDTITEAQQTWPAPNQYDFNPWIRDGLPTFGGAYAATGTGGATRAGDVGSPFAGWVEAAAAVETSLGSWKWIPGATGDGTHISTGGHNLIKPAIQSWAQSMTL